MKFCWLLAYISLSYSSRCEWIDCMFGMVCA